MSVKSPDPVDLVVAHNIRIQRIARRVSQTELADALGVTFQQVQKYERGINRVGAGRLVRIAAVLDVPVTALLDGSDGERGRGPSPLAMMAQRQPYRLVAAFSRIDDKRLRRLVVDLVDRLARRRGA